MARSFDFQIVRLLAQKDNYKSLSTTDFSDIPFLESPDKEAEILHFKRIVVDGLAIGPHNNAPVADPFKILISLRGNIVTVIPPSKGLVTISGLYAAVTDALANFYTGSAALRPAIEKADGPWVCTTSDGLRLADVFHHLREHGGFKHRLHDPIGWRAARYKELTGNPPA